MHKNNPTRTVSVERTMRGQAGQGTGWLESLQRRAADLKAQMQGVHARITSPFKNGFPSCAQGELQFNADLQTTITIANFPTDPETLDAADFISPLLVNPIIRAGQTYRIPLTFTPPGVLMARYLSVGIEAGFTAFNNVPRSGLFMLGDYRQRAGGAIGGGGFVASPGGLGFQLGYTWQQQVLGNFAEVVPYLPYFWNIVDEKSGRQYGQDLIPSGALLNTRFLPTSSNKMPDSDMFEFDYPWLFERDAQVAFLFRPIMDLYQVAAGDATLPWGTTDLNGGRRTQQATVKVELHGTRYYDNRDIRKDGAVL